MKITIRAKLDTRDAELVLWAENHEDNIILKMFEKIWKQSDYSKASTFPDAFKAFYGYEIKDFCFGSAIFIYLDELLDHDENHDTPPEQEFEDPAIMRRVVMPYDNSVDQAPQPPVDLLPEPPADLFIEDGSMDPMVPDPDHIDAEASPIMIEKRPTGKIGSTRFCKLPECGKKFKVET